MLSYSSFKMVEFNNHSQLNITWTTHLSYSLKKYWRKKKSYIHFQQSNISAQIYTVTKPHKYASRTSNFGSPVQRLRSRNSSWIVVTSEVLLSGLHLGEWALRVARFISEYGTPESELKHGSNRVPKSTWKTICKRL